MFKIMIVEDSEQLQNEIGNILTKNGYEVIKITEFNNVSDKIKEDNPNLILLDINLPKEDGFKICTEIRSFSSYIGDKGLILNIGVSSALMILIYGCYFIGTYYSFKRNINDELK